MILPDTDAPIACVGCGAPISPSLSDGVFFGYKPSWRCSACKEASMIYWTERDNEKVRRQIEDLEEMAPDVVELGRRNPDHEPLCSLLEETIRYLAEAFKHIECIGAALVRDLGDGVRGPIPVGREGPRRAHAEVLGDDGEEDDDEEDAIPGQPAASSDEPDTVPPRIADRVLDDAADVARSMATRWREEARRDHERRRFLLAQAEAADMIAEALGGKR